MIVRDWNLVSEPETDRSSRPLPSNRPFSIAFHEFPSLLGLVDVWRKVKIDTREYTFYSKALNSYSRIYHFTISNCMLENVIILMMKTTLKCAWKFNNSLKDKEFMSLIKNRICEFITLKIDSVSSIQTVWEALKATSRGWIISYSTAKKKQSIDERHKLQLSLKVLERKHMQNPNNLGIKRELFLVKSKLQTFIHKETACARKPLNQVIRQARY